MSQVTATVYGDVQGVGYRWWCKKTAEQLGVGGFVMNTREGTVIVVACGTLPQLTTLVKALKGGPAYARVDEVRVEWDKGDQPYSGFEVRHEPR